MTRTSFLAAAAALALYSCGQGEPKSITGDSADQGSTALSAPTHFLWTCANGQSWTVTRYKLELFGYTNFVQETRIAEAATQTSGGALNAPGPLTCACALAPAVCDIGGTTTPESTWNAPRVKLPDGIYELRITPYGSFDSPVTVITEITPVAEPMSVFCSVPAGLSFAGEVATLPSCANFNVSGVPRVFKLLTPQ